MPVNPGARVVCRLVVRWSGRQQTQTVTNLLDIRELGYSGDRVVGMSPETRDVFSMVSVDLCLADYCNI